MTTHEKPKESTCCSVVVPASALAASAAARISRTSSSKTAASIGLKHTPARPVGREPERRLEREGGRADAEEAVEVGARGRALAAQDVEQAHRPGA